MLGESARNRFLNQLTADLELRLEPVPRKLLLWET